MKNTNGAMPFSEHELRQFLYPLTLTAFAILILLFMEGLLVERPPNYLLMVYSAAGSRHVIAFDRLMRSSPQHALYSNRVNPITSGIGLGLLPHLPPGRLIEIFHILSILGITGVASLPDDDALMSTRRSSFL